VYLPGLLADKLLCFDILFLKYITNNYFKFK
jgi:hypothetical protein